MLKSLAEIVRQLLGYANDTQKNKDDIEAIQTELEDALDKIDKFIYGLQRLSENEAHERDKLWLRTQLAMKDVTPLALPSTSQDKIAEILARLEVLERGNEELKKQVEELKTK